MAAGALPGKGRSSAEAGISSFDGRDFGAIPPTDAARPA